MSLVMQEIGWEDLKTRRAIHKLLLYFKIVNNLCPSYLVDLLPLLVSERTNYSLRTASNYSIFASRTDRYKRSFFPQLLAFGTTSVMIYVVLIPLALLRKLYSPLSL